MAAAEIYNPSDNRWTLISNMAESRNEPTAHLLPDGKVLVVGGYNLGGELNTVELCDPLTGSWTPRPPFPGPRRRNAGVLLSGATTLLIAGGVSNFFFTTAVLYAVDGSGSVVIPYGAMGGAHRGVLLHDGSVLVTADGNATARRFDPVTSNWTTSAISGSRDNLTLTVLADGRVLAAGGARFNADLNTTEIYNPDVNVWTAGAPMAEARRSAVAALLTDGSVLVVSGASAAGQVNATERYTP